MGTSEKAPIFAQIVPRKGITVPSRALPMRVRLALYGFVYSLNRAALPLCSFFSLGETDHLKNIYRGRLDSRSQDTGRGKQSPFLSRRGRKRALMPKKGCMPFAESGRPMADHWSPLQLLRAAADHAFRCRRAVLMTKAYRARPPVYRLYDGCNKPMADP